MGLVRRVLLLLLVLAAPAWAGAPALPGTGAATGGGPARLSASFIQLLEPNRTWSRERWERLFDTFREIGLKQVVVQWTVHDDSTFFAPPADGKGLAPVQAILQLAQERGIEVYLGLAAESRYWEMIKGPPERQDQYLARLRLKSERVARELAPIAARYRSFRGWYLPEEIDGLSWRAPKSREVLRRHLGELTGYLKRLDPRGKILLSCFCAARMDPESYREFWDDLLAGSSLDLLLFQDGAGERRLPRELLPLYLEAAGSAARARARGLQVVVELFTTVSESPFRAVPAPMSRVSGQLQLAARYSSAGINAFSVPDYMSAEGGPAALELLAEYRRYEKGGDQAPPSR